MKYTVYARTTTYLTLEVEADNIDDAWAIAYDTDGGCWDVADDDWEMCDIKEGE